MNLVTKTIAIVIAASAGLFFALATDEHVVSADATAHSHAVAPQASTYAALEPKHQALSISQAAEPATELAPDAPESNKTTAQEEVHVSAPQVGDSEVATAILDAQQFMLAQVNSRTWSHADSMEFHGHFAVVDDATRETLLAELTMRVNDGTIVVDKDVAVF